MSNKKEKVDLDETLKKATIIGITISAIKDVITIVIEVIKLFK